MTRTPAMPSCSVDRFWPMFSRTSRYAAFESRWNLRDATMMTGITSIPTSVSCHDVMQSEHQREPDEQDRRHELQQAELHEFAHRLDVGGHAGDEHTRLVAVEERQRLLLDVVEHPDAQRAQESLARHG